jgi:hypothetical protein
MESPACTIRDAPARPGTNCIYIWYIWYLWYGVSVVKTTVYLPAADMQALKAAAHRRHQSEAELIREGIRRVLADEAGSAMPNFGILDADPVTAAEIDAALAEGLGAAGIDR